jgi:single-strand DNA-binding protein
MADTHVTITGNLTDDPELRFTPGGVAVANFRLAVDQRVWDTDGWKDGESSYFRVSVWRDQAEHVSRSLHKGARCVVVGRLRSHSWETPEGQRRSAVEVHAEEVGMSLRFTPVVPPPAEDAPPSPAPARAKADGNGSRRGRQPAKAAAGRDEAPF